MKTIGVIGLAATGEDRLKSFTPSKDVRVDSICTLNESLLAQRAEQFGIDRTTTDWREMIADDSLDAVCICTPNNLHAAMAEAAMLAGKDLLLEYPMGITLDEIDRLLKVADQTGRVFHIGATTRHEPQHVAVRERLASLGEPMEIHGVLAWHEMWKWARDWSVMGSYFALANAHFVDHIADWYGAPEWVTGSLWQKLENEAVSAISGSMFFGYESGLSAHVNYTMGVPVQKAFLNFEVIGTESRITWRDDVLQQHFADGSSETIPLGENDSFQPDTDQFIAELHGEPMFPTPAEAAIPARICLLAEQSAHEGNVTLRY
jgi:predicted dehydrogenase